MIEYENLRMVELLHKFRKDILKIEEERTPQLFREARKNLQEIYSLHLQSQNNFKCIAHYLKSIYKSFNYAAATVNEALLKKPLTPESLKNLDECLELMIRCCDVSIAKLR